jgi:hypothetical protein
LGRSAVIKLVGKFAGDSLKKARKNAFVALGAPQALAGSFAPGRHDRGDIKDSP